MADKLSNRKKRKTRTSSEEKQQQSKRQHPIPTEEEESKRQHPIPTEEEESKIQVSGDGRGGPCCNSQWIMAIIDKKVDIKTKIQLAHDFINLRKNIVNVGDFDEGSEDVSILREIQFLNERVQSLLMSENNNEFPVSEVTGTYLDFRCWEIFKFCLEEYSKLRMSLKFPKNLLHAISGVSRNALSLLNDTSMHSEESLFVGQGFELHSVVLDCISLVFNSHGGLLNENLHLWISAVDVVLQLVLNIYKGRHDSDNTYLFVLRFACLVLQPFHKFLRIHPCRRAGFPYFIDKLLEPLLQILGEEHNHVDGNIAEWDRNLFELAGEVLSQGLFHPVQIDGFLCLRNTEKYDKSLDVKSKNSKVQSYNGRLFVSLENIMASTNLPVACGLGELFRLFVHLVKNKKITSMKPEGITMMNNRGDSAKSDSSISLRTDIQKSLVNFFVQIMDPLLLKIKDYNKSPEVGQVLLDVHCTLKSATNILAVFMHEKLHVGTEDTSDSGCLDFLKYAYNIITSFPIEKIQLLLLACGTNEKMFAEILISIAKELIVAVGLFLEIDYEVIGNSEKTYANIMQKQVLENDLVNFWLMVFSFLALGQCMVDAPDQSSLNLKLLGLGCQMINLYSDLRQVDTIIIALCKAVRNYISRYSDGEMNLPDPTSVGNLICTQEFMTVICNAVKSIPEGQTSICISQLSLDISVSLDWIKPCCSEVSENNFKGIKLKSWEMKPCSAEVSENNLKEIKLKSWEVSRLVKKTEILGRCLSEIYTLVLDSLTVTSGNSTLVANSMNEMMTKIHPGMITLVEAHSNNISDIIFPVIRISENKMGESKKELLKSKGSTHWVFLFFFRLYMSCRSLYQQTISLLPPNSSKTISAELGDLITAYPGRDSMEVNNWKDKGYFSWIAKSSASLLLTIKTVSDIYVQEDVPDCSPLIYILHDMALQRLVYLNGLINSYDYLLHNMATTKKMRKWRKSILVEAEGLTEYITEYLSLVSKKKQFFNANDAWDLSVGDVSGNSLPIAILWLLCQNTDIWCCHAKRKKLKKFLSVLIRSSLLYTEDIHDNIHEPTILGVTVQRISSELLRDTILYEQRFVRRYLASVFCDILQDSLPSLSINSTFKANHFSELPDWSEAMSALDMSSMAVLDSPSFSDDYSSVAVQQNPHFSNDAHPLTSTEIGACHSLLNLLCWMPKDYFTYKSFSQLTTFILNLERIVVGNLLTSHTTFNPQNNYELLRLLVSCRRALKCLIIASCKERGKSSPSSLVSMIFQGSSFILWLLTSVSSVIGIQHAFLEHPACQHKHLIFSLMDHTSYMCLTLSKDQFRVALQTTITNLEDNLIDNDTEMWKNVILVSEALKEQTKNLLITLKDAFQKGRTLFNIGTLNINKLSSFLACMHGFLWGLASALNELDTNTSKTKPKLSKLTCKPISDLILCINVFENFINFLVRMLCFKGDQWRQSICDAQNPIEIDLLDLQCVDKHMLQSLLNGDNHETAYLLRQLFIASSAILRLNKKIKRTPFQPTLMPTYISISQILLSEFSISVEVPPPLSVLCLHGVLKYLEEIGNQFSLDNPTLTRDVYAQLVHLHLMAIGKCISLQGKTAFLASHDRESSTKTLGSIDGLSEVFCSRVPFCLDELKFRLRSSFKVFVSKPSELYLLSDAIHVLERALVGVRKDSTSIYEVSMGKVSSVFAAGIDCLDLLLEFVAGPKRLKVVKEHIQSLINGLFNIIVQLQQSPLIFHDKINHNKGDADPDPGSAILMCIEVLTRISGKHALFRMDSCRIQQCLHVPTSLFQGFHQLQLTEATTQSFVVDRRFSVDLFAACCRLLYTTLKHHQSECEQCIAILERSVSVLLQCLETVDADSLVTKKYFSWEIQEGVKCASILRRIYEEIRHQKDVFGRYSPRFLTTYIWIYSGNGPLQTGIKREIDEALRPGVYALMDVCSNDELKHLHTVFGEGSYRSTLKVLHDDYKLNFQYEGKV